MKAITLMLLLFNIQFGFSQDKEYLDSLRSTVRSGLSLEWDVVDSYSKLIHHFGNTVPDTTLYYLSELKKFSKSKQSDLGYYRYYYLKGSYFQQFASNIELDSMELYFLKSIEYAEKLKVKSIYYQVESYYSLYYNFLYYSDINKSHFYANKAFTIGVENRDLKAIPVGSIALGNVYYYGLNQFDEALYYLNIGDRVLTRTDPNSTDLGYIKVTTGMIFFKMVEYEKAKIYFKEAKLIYEYHNDEANRYYVNDRLAEIDLENGELELALAQFEESYAYYVQRKDDLRILETASLISAIYKRLNEYDLSLEYANINFEKSVSLKDTNSIVNSYVSKSDLYRFYNNSEASVEMAQKGYDLCTFKFMLDRKLELVKLLYRGNEALGNYEEAYKYLTEFNSINDSLIEIRNSEKALELQEKYESDKKESEILALKAQSELARQQKKSERNMLLTGISVTSIIGVFFFFLYRNRQKTNQKLIELDSLKTRFFENISHEFRTPLTLIKVPLSKSLKTGEKLTDKTTKIIHENTSRLQNLVENLLSISELDAGKMKVKKTEQNPIQQAKVLASQFDSYASSKGIKYIKIIEEKQITAIYDRTVLDRVLLNLVSNAIKYSSRGDNVTVEISRDTDNLIVSVSDTGNGISKENQKKIFDRFYQIGDKDEGVQGSGIGLALVKKVLELNHGTIDVESKFGQGSTFKVVLPLEKIKEIIEVTPEYLPKNELKTPITEPEDIVGNVAINSKPKLLIVEDNEELSDYLNDLFNLDFEIAIAGDGQEGMEKAIETVPNIILSDWMMPKMNGIELCNNIKENSITSHIPFVLLTAKSDVENKIKGYETGADAYFSKPFDYDELKAQLNNLLLQRKLLLEKYSSSESPLLNIPTTNSRDVAFWNDFKKFLETNIKESELSANSIADALSMSRMQLHRKLTALTGQTVSIIIKNQRMQLAKELLRDPAVRISDVCYEIGYTDTSAFARAFKKEFGSTPSDYRKNIAK